MKIDDGGPAYPRPIGHTPNIGASFSRAQEGMTLRDYFAGQFLAGIAANPAMVNRRGTKTSWSYGEDAWTMEQFAKDMSFEAYRVADAMLAARAIPHTA